MPKNDNPQSLKLCESVKKNAGSAAADELSKTLPLSKSADCARKFKWTQNVCAWLEENFNSEQIKNIRTGCSCTPSPVKIERIKRLWESSRDPGDFVSLFNSEFSPDNTVHIEGDTLFFSYPRCFCSCVSRVAETLPQTWCLCSLGYVKKLFSGVLRDDADIRLVESVKLGGSRCVISMKIK